MTARAVYVGIDPRSGRIVAAEESASDAAAAMKRAGVERFWMEDDGSVRDLEMKANPRDMNPAAVVRRAGLRPVSESEAQMPLREAWERVYHTFFASLRRQGVAPKSLMTPGGLAVSIVAENAKLAKGAEVQASPVSLTMRADLVGINLMPADKLYSRKKGQLSGYPVWYPDDPNVPLIDPIVEKTKMRTFCAGSNVFCQASCLVFTGSNKSDHYNNHAKQAKALALLADPAAFLRLVDDGIARAYRSARSKGHRLLVRMNLLSDIPWEAICPWLFDKYPDVQFYDYTKVSGRKPPANYDLTFSFSGTNESAARQALYEKNQRIAVVFLAKKLSKGEWTAVGEKTRREMGASSLPEVFDLWGDSRLVVNADVNDARFLDPPNEIDGVACVAGLTWKTPKGQKVKVDDKFGFVTPAYLLDGERPVLVAPVTPRSQGALVGGG